MQQLLWTQHWVSILPRLRCFNPKPTEMALRGEVCRRHVAPRAWCPSKRNPWVHLVFFLPNNKEHNKELAVCNKKGALTRPCQHRLPGLHLMTCLLRTSLPTTQDASFQMSGFLGCVFMHLYIWLTHSHPLLSQDSYPYLNL